MNMRNVFILNPVAGKGGAMDLKKVIKEKASELSINVEICQTREELDAEVLASQIASKATKEHPVRIFACGGDGTINEILNGIIGYENVYLGVLPVGSGNDFVRNFGKVSDFLDIKSQLNGKSFRTDVIKYRWKKNNYNYERYGINMFNIGFDCNVVEAATRMKNIPLISGSMAYLMGVFSMLIKLKGANLKVDFNDGTTYEGELLLMAIANGWFCGGGIKGVPFAVTNDGLMDVSLIKRCSRCKCIRLLPKYVKGAHMKTKEAEEIVIYKQCKSIKVSKLGDDIMFSPDGEIAHADEIEFEIVPNAINLIIPNR